jgi:hypothetical protein
MFKAIYLQLLDCTVQNSGKCESRAVYRIAAKQSLAAVQTVPVTYALFQLIKGVAISDPMHPSAKWRHPPHDHLLQ